MAKLKQKKNSTKIIHLTVQTKRHNDFLSHSNNSSSEQRKKSTTENSRGCLKNDRQHMFSQTKMNASDQAWNMSVPSLSKKSPCLDLIHADFHHHRSIKKKNKCTRRHILVSFLVVLLFLIFIVILPPILVFKLKTTETRNVVLRWNTTGITMAGIVGIAGNTNTTLNRPYDVVVDWSRTLYIADYNNHRVQKYLMDASTGSTIAGDANGIGGNAANRLKYPSRLVVDTNSNIYIVDRSNFRVQFWPNGAVTGIRVAGTGSAGSGNNELNGPYGIQRDSNTGTLYIADYDNHRVISYAYNASFGNVVAGGHGAGLNTTQLNRPTGLYFDSLTNSLIITNYDSHNVVRWVLGANDWQLRAGTLSGLSGSTSDRFNRPTEVTLDPMGNMYIADYSNHRVQFFGLDQPNGTTIAGMTGTLGNTSTLLNTPFSIDLDSQLNLYVVDSSNHRIQKFVRY